MRRPRFCVFCGKVPERKNSEHVVPMWLIKLTGKPSRLIHLGFVYGRKLHDTISASSFKFPACKSCNDAHATLEGRAKSVVLRLLDEEPLSSFDWDVLLDWLDKVRIGVFLGYRQLHRMDYEGPPSYYIGQRIGSADRFAYVYKSGDKRAGVSWAGVDNHLFNVFPACFLLRINNYILLNGSLNFLLAHNAGLPFPVSVTYQDPLTPTEYIVAEGTKTVQSRLLKLHLPQPHVGIFQPCIPPVEFLPQAMPLNFEPYISPFVKSHLLYPNQNKGLIYYSRNNGPVQELPHLKSTLCIPEPADLHNNLPNLLSFMGLETARLLINFAKRSDQYIPYERESAKLIQAHLRPCIRLAEQYVYMMSHQDEARRWGPDYVRRQYTKKKNKSH